MRHSFSGSFTKINRAKKHLSELEYEIEAFIQSNPVKFDVTVTKNGASAATVHIQTQIAGIPEAIGAIVGDIVHNLRSALDLTASEMARIAGNSDKDVYFPFGETEEHLDIMIAKRHFDRAGPDAVELLRSLKPYKSGHAALRAIHDLDVQDKHRTLIPQVLSAASPVFRTFRNDGEFSPQIVGDPTTPSEISVLFPNSDSQGPELIPTLHELVQLTDGIVEAFMALANRE